MDYSQALEKLHSLNRFGVRPGLERERELLRRLGDPQNDPHIRFVHIAGTNGKGSCGAALQSMLRAAGYRTGFFSSPHLLHHCERYRIDGAAMSEAEFADLFAPVWQELQAMTRAGWDSPTEFEAVTALCLLWFHERQADFAVLECGLGGLYDSTNVIDSQLAIITNVALDHMEYLGETRELIAEQKAGIIRPGRPLVSAAEEPARTVIAAKARELRAIPYFYGRDFQGNIRDAEQDRGQYLDLNCGGDSCQNLFLPLLGSYQLKNIACAVQAAQLLGLDAAAIWRGLARMSWPCRLEVVSRQPLVVMDGAHNEDAFQALAQAVRQYWPGKSLCCLVGMLDDKQREAALSHILPLVKTVVITRPNQPARSRDWQQTAAPFRQAGLPVLSVENSRDALAAALGQGCDLTLICGSLYLAADLRGCFTYSQRI